MQEETFIAYLNRKGIEITQNKQTSILILELLEEKDKTIVKLEEQITKYKCQDIKNQKLIKSLQDKISQLAPSISDTGSNFMMASQFKNNFEAMMTTTVSSALEGLFDRPQLFSKCLNDILNLSYQRVQNKLNKVLKSIGDVLMLDEETTNALQGKLKISLLKVFQQYWTNLFPFEQQLSLEYIHDNESNLVQELNQILISEDFIQLRKQLHRLVVYMVLQQKQWRFVNSIAGTVIIYNKKEHNRIDGWVNEGEEAVLVLEGVKRDGHMHANLKNYVIPFQEVEQKDTYAELTLKVKQTHSSEMKRPCMRVDKSVLTSPIACQTIEPNFLAHQRSEQSSLLTKNKSVDALQSNKQNHSHHVNGLKKPKKQNKDRKSLEKSLKNDKSPRSKIKAIDSVRSKKIDSQQARDCYLQEKIQTLKDDMFARKKNSAGVFACHSNNPNNHELVIEDLAMFGIKRKAVQQLPVSKQIPRKKTKTASSRKNSVGKIVCQANKDKENCQQQANAKTKARDKAYKDIIKEKLQDKLIGKTDLSLSMLHPKSKTDRDIRRKQQNRPLKIQGNVSKLRQKYIN